MSQWKRKLCLFIEMISMMIGYCCGRSVCPVLLIASGRPDAASTLLLHGRAAVPRQGVVPQSDVHQTSARRRDPAGPHLLCGRGRARSSGHTWAYSWRSSSHGQQPEQVSHKHLRGDVTCLDPSPSLWTNKGWPAFGNYAWIFITGKKPGIICDFGNIMRIL